MTDTPTTVFWPGVGEVTPDQARELNGFARTVTGHTDCVEGHRIGNPDTSQVWHTVTVRDPRDMFHHIQCSPTSSLRGPTQAREPTCPDCICARAAKEEA